MADVKIEKPSKEELGSLGVDSWGTWEKEISDFDWQYGESETFYVLEGRAKVDVPDGEVEFGPGDLVTFPAGMKCTWHVLEPIRKKYTFGLEKE
ncbi:cupin domain-containing protein [Candidatus Altiarchaeota archaeon]